MYLTINSMELYKGLQNYRAQCRYPGNKGFEDTMAWYYIDLIKTMFFELILSRQSDLLSWLCIGNQVKYSPECFSFSISTNGVQQQSNYDLYPIVQSLLALFQNDFRTCYTVYINNIKYLFANYQLSLEGYNKQILQCLVDIDATMRELKGNAILQQVEEMTQCCNQQKAKIKTQEQRLAEQERQLAEQKQQLVELEQQLVEQKRWLTVQEQQPIELEQQLATQEEQLTEQGRQPMEEEQASQEGKVPLEQDLTSIELAHQISKEDESDSMSYLPLSERLKMFANNRQKEDADLLQRIQHLQVNLQSELQEIAKIREGLEYETLRESISQVLAIHDLLWDILESHPMRDSAKGYENLIDSCRDLRENIVEALAMLGVTYIYDTEVPYDPAMHCTSRGVQPTRNAIITKVLRPGFSYQSKTLEKAVVELQ